VSVIENFICKAVRGIELESKLEVAEKIVKEYTELTQTCAMRCPDLKFAAVQPMLRPMEPWFTENHKSITNWIEEGIKSMNQGNVKK
jgi:hypothetical protein